MRSYTTSIFIDRAGQEIEVEVTGNVSPYIRAVTHRLPEDCHPTEGGEIEITHVVAKFAKTSEPVRLDIEDLTSNERETAEERLFEVSQDDDFCREWDDE